ncbi:MAG: DUF2914 domain-containing protein [Deltaproteobacteria bacterium]|nr:DUF2914 domain-containing protein [Deltaproteobacteria bacterium]MBW1930219.1 DUF2914 domain-containing protein [Deltaproteobacteria bacterium]MBW2024282.1 DUF2914 domain-containing protein [Deltaproteobacteria bacterium]MBW2126075.1 DUF2914 domain-containing protein [Deltaproteobacteria bacterium]
MKRGQLICLVVALLFVSFVLSSQSVLAAESSPLQVAEASICVDVVGLQCQGGDTTFSSHLGKLYCFTRIIGAQSPTQIFHVWYYKDKERARVPLQVNSPNWRTYSSKLIQSHEIGQWRVEVLGPDNKLIKSIYFQVVP